MRSKWLAIGLSLLLVSLSVGACEPPCQCGEWGNVEVEWFESDLPIPTGTWTGSCGETVTTNHTEAAYKVSVNFGQSMNCIDCSSPQPAYYWDITGPGGYSYSGGPATTPYVSFPGDVGTYQVVLNAECDGVECPPCTLWINVEEECEWTECGIINNVNTSPWTTGWTGQTVITFQECDGDAYTLWGPPSLADTYNTVSLGSYADCQCVQYCYIEEDGKKIITQWTTVSLDDNCCDNCCLFCCEVDFSFIPVGGGGPDGGPPSLCPEEILIYQYNLTNNSDYQLNYYFTSSTLASQTNFFPGAGTVDANGGEQTITVHYTMPGNSNYPCNQSSYTFTHALNITIVTDGDSVECAPIESSVLINCHNCPEPEHKMHYPQLPDVHGWDVFSCDSWAPDEDIQVADDWECTETGLVENIRFWGSWKDDVLGEITGFHIEIWDNNPGGDYSHPDDLLWESFITDYTSQEIQTLVPEGWYNPFADSHEDYNHNAHYQYDISDIQDAFPQEEGNIYWLSIWPVVDGTGVWGWKSSEDHWMDDACWRRFDSPPPGPWQALYEPTPVVQSLDLAFIIYGGEVSCQCEEWGQAQVTWTNENGQQTSELLDCQTGMGLTSIEGETITVHPSITCSSSCEQHIPTALWQVIKYSTGSAIESGSGLEAHFEPDETDSYTVEFYNVTCDGVDCEDCSITLRVTLISPRCRCGEWEELTISSGDWQEAVECGETIDTPPGVGAVGVTASYICTPPEYCEARYEWEVSAPLNLDETCYSSPCVFGFALPDKCVKVYISTFCDDTLCDECIFTVCPPECIAPPAGLVAWWPLDEAQGTVSHDLTNNNHGQWVGSPTPQLGMVAGALSFDSVNDYLEIPNAVELNVGTGDFSIDAWVKTNEASGVHTILDKREKPELGYLLYLYNGNLGFQLADASGYNNYNSNLSVADGNWHHIAVTVDRDDPNGLVFYVDDVQEIHNPTNHQGSLNNNHSLLIAGNCLTSFQNFSSGKIDEVELYNRALSEAEVLEIYEAGSYGKCKH